MSEARSIIPVIIDSLDLSKDERKRIWSDIVSDIACFLDKSELYISEEIEMHCFMTLIEVGDVFDIEDTKEQEDVRKRFTQDSARAMSLIKGETGLEKIGWYFRTVTKPKLRSEHIKSYQEAKRKYMRRGRTG